MHPALAENLIRAGEQPGRALRPVPCWTVRPRVRGRFPATTNAGKRLYLLRHGGKEWLDQDRHSRIAGETRKGREVAGMEGLYSHVALAMEQEIADSLQSRWLRFAASERALEGAISHCSTIRS